MTTLFNLFCPFLLKSNLIYSVLVLILITMSISIYSIYPMMMLLKGNSTFEINKLVFPLSGSYSFIMFSIFMNLALINLFSMTIYSFPVTTSMSFNLNVAFMLWMSGIFIQSMSSQSFSTILPSNSPWYLIPFLGIVELVSVLVRPVTLCFRLLANMSAGHILLTLICKMFGFWLLGTLFGVLELLVSVVQSFVFLMLVGVYLEESMMH